MANNKPNIQTYGGGVLSQSLTVTSGNTLTTGIAYDRFLNAWVSVPNTGGVLTPTGVIDPTNISTNEAALIDGNLTNLHYHNSSTGSANKELAAIDLGSSLPVSGVNVHWWNNTYTASDYKIQGSNDGTTWTDLSTGNNSTGMVGTAANPQVLAITGSWRYLRVFCVTGNNATWCVISELQALGVAGGSTNYNIFELDDVLLTNDGTNLVIENNLGVDVDIEINYL